MEISGQVFVVVIVCIYTVDLNYNKISCNEISAVMKRFSGAFFFSSLNHYTRNSAVTKAN